MGHNSPLRRGRNTTKIVLFAAKGPQQAGTIARYFRDLCGKFVTWRINRISPPINEFEPP
jgi:hypothetical protein